LERGKLMAVDYGFGANEQFSPVRTRGTLRAYHQHRVSDDLLAHPGEQDLTAHVDFPAIQKIGEAAGMKTVFLCPQPQFLTRILAEAMKNGSFAALDAKQARQFQTLAHPEHLGRAFRVLLQER
jgi:SAM-dependent MidA family methyltransferase